MGQNSRSRRLGAMKGVFLLAKLRVPLLLGTLQLAGCTGLHQSPQQAQSKPRDENVLFITLDTTRADHLSCYMTEGLRAANRGAKTPYLDGLAARGMRFAHATSQVPLTL